MEDQMRITLERITPERSGDWLLRNNHNRPVSPTQLANFTKAMRAGWKLNGETIKFSTLGDLLDGQHRLLACVEADVAFDSYVAFNVDATTFDTIDIGRKRTAGDILGIAQIPNGRNTAAAVRCVAAINTNDWSYGGSKGLDPGEILKWIDANPGIVNSVVMAGRSKHILETSLGAALHFLFSQKSQTAADLFFQDLAVGIDLGSDDSVRLLREKLLKNKGAKARLKRGEVCALAMRAWNRRRTASPTNQLRGSILRQDGKLSYPELV